MAVEVRHGDIRVGTTVELLVLAARAHTLAGIDLHSGGLVWVTYPHEATTASLRPFDVIVGATARPPLDDPSRPDSVGLSDTPRVTGRLRGRRAERWIRPLLHPKDEHLLGFAGPAIPYWTLRGDRPSLAVVEPKGPVVVHGDRDGLHCRFLWRNLPHELPFTDLRTKVASAAHHGGIKVHRRLLVALTPPYLGHCYKVVAALLPR